MKRLTAGALGALPVLLALAACGEETSGEPSTDPATEAPMADDQEFFVATTVLESPDHGPRLCHAVMESMPPQCGGGPEVAGWDWSRVTAEQASGTTWGVYELTGTWDGERFTLTKPPAEPAPDGSEPALDPAGLDLEPTGRSLAELEEIQQALNEDFPDDILTTWIDEEFDVVQAQVVVADDALRQTIEERFGTDAVVLHGWLQPAP